MAYLSIENIKKMDYTWTQPETYLVFVPGISTILKVAHLANMLPLQFANQLLLGPGMQQAVQADKEGRKFIRICSWHALGSFIQATAFFIISKRISDMKFFAVLAVIAACDGLHSIFERVIRRVSICAFYHNGNMVLRSEQVSFML